MLESQRLELRASEIRERLNEIGGLEGDAYTDEVKSEEAKLQTEYRDVETRKRSALIAEGKTEDRKETDAMDAETRERLELRGRTRVADFLDAAMRGRVLAGAAAEYSEAEGARGDIPLALFERDPREERETEDRAVTGAPGTVGVNMAPIQPAIFAPSIAPYMGIDMPRVASGTFGQARINASLTAAAKAKGADAAATAATFAIGTTTPKRVSARLEFLAEDVASAGVSNFESALRENLSLALSAELDEQVINGDGTAPNLAGLFSRLTGTADTTTLTFAHGLAKLAGLIDGLWAGETGEIRQIVGVDTFRLAATLVTSAATGEVTLSEYLKRVSGGFRTNARMPDKASDVQAGLAFRSGRAGMRTAVCPHWGRIGITDVYSGSAKAETAVTFHVLLGDVLVIQPGAYAETSYKLA